MNSSPIRGIRRKKSLLSEIKVVVIGAPGVGKSENRYKNEALINGDPVLFEIVDTCPKNIDDLMSAELIQWADGFLFVYSILERASLDYVRKASRHIATLRNSANIPCVLIANKADMIHLRQVSTEEGEQLAKEMECTFTEVAAAEQVTPIAEAFMELGREIHAAKRRSKPPQGPSLFDRVLGNRSSATIGLRAYARGKSDSALPKD